MAPSSSQVATDLLPGVLARGTTVGRYVILDVIGRGGMGIIYSAFDAKLDRKLAIKILRSDVATGDSSDDVESYLLREAQAMARLTHPNVVAVHDVGTHEHRVFLAMEFVEGVTLRQWLTSPRSLRERLSVMRAAGRGLAAAHAAGIIHRDFKPDNVVVGAGGRVVVLDFGLALAAASPPSQGAAASPDESAAATPAPPRKVRALGTVGYLAPEIAFGEAANPATDQFSFAATLYFALYGERPFPETEFKRYLAELQDPPRPPQMKGHVPAWVHKIALRGLSFDPAERFPSMDALVAALARDPMAAKRRALFAAATALLLVLCGFVAANALRSRERACREDASALAGVWDPTIRAAMLRSFDASGDVGAPAAALRVATKLDEFALLWTQMNRESCRATRVEKTQSEDVYRIRADCLERERTKARAITAALATADLGVVKRSIEIAYGLPQPSWCADVATLRASAGLPDDPQKRGLVLKIRDNLAEIDSQRLVGNLTQAALLASAAVAAAREVEHAPTTAETLLAQGEILRWQGAYEAALPSLMDAVFLATEAGADAVAVRAASTLAHLTGAKLQRPNEPHIWIELARSALRRMGGNEELDLDILEDEASIKDEAEWRPDLSKPLREKIVAAYRRIYGVHPKTALAIYLMGVNLSYLGEARAARPYLEEARAMSESLGGPLYADVGRCKFMLGQSAMSLGELENGETLVRESLAIFEANAMDYWSALSFQQLTWLALARGDVAGAVSKGESARSLLARAKSPSVLVPIVNVPAATALIRAGRASEALLLCDAALAEQERANAIDPAKAYWADAMTCKAEALLASKRPGEALGYLERSLTIKRRMFPGDYPRAEFALARALASLHRDEARVGALLSAARSEFARSPSLVWENRAVEAFGARR